MITGYRKITYEEIIEKTNGGYDIYYFYHGGVPKKCKSPFRRDDHASFGFYSYNGIWLWKDIGLDSSGGPVEYVMTKFGLKYNEAVDKISWDFGFNNSEVTTKSSVITWKTPRITPKYSHISFTTTKFDYSHAQYWNDYHLSEDYLKKYNIFRVKDLAINRKKIRLRETELTYVYWAEDIDKAKILRIGVEKDNKWRSNIPFNYLWYINKYEKCDKLLVCKSNKDALVLSLFGLCVSSTMSENSSCITEENIDKINNVSLNPYLAYGTDSQAKKASIAITEKTKWKHLNMPDKYLEHGANDFAEVAKLFGLKAVEQHLKNKKII